MIGTLTLDSRVGRQFFKNAAAFQSHDADRPELELTLVEVAAASDGRAVIRTVSTDSYKMLVQKLVVPASQHRHAAYRGPRTVDAHELVKASPARKGSCTYVENELADAVTVSHLVTGATVDVDFAGVEFPKWSQLLVEPDRFDGGESGVYGIAGAALEALGTVLEPVDGGGLGVSWSQSSTVGKSDQSYRPVQFSAMTKPGYWSACALVMPYRPGVNQTLEHARTLSSSVKGMDA